MQAYNHVRHDVTSKGDALIFAFLSLHRLSIPFQDDDDDDDDDYFSVVDHIVTCVFIL